jgi:hypothetical protein
VNFNPLRIRQRYAIRVHADDEGISSAYRDNSNRPCLEWQRRGSRNVPDQPHQPFSGSPHFPLVLEFLILDQIFQSGGLFGSFGVPSSDFLLGFGTGMSTIMSVLRMDAREEKSGEIESAGRCSEYKGKERWLTAMFPFKSL